MRARGRDPHRLRARLVALADGGFGTAFAVIVLYLVINQSESVLQTSNAGE